MKRVFFVGRREDTLDRYGDKWKISNRSIFLDQRILPRAISIFFLAAHSQLQGVIYENNKRVCKRYG